MRGDGSGETTLRARHHTAQTLIALMVGLIRGDEVLNATEEGARDHTVRAFLALVGCLRL